MAAAFFRLPHNARRTLYRWARPDSYANLQQLRRDPSAFPTYAPFDRHNCIFVHIPRTGGTSITQSLFGNQAGGHTPVWKYQIVFSKSQYDRYYKFTFVRNPWDRLVSSYHRLKGGGLTRKGRIEMTETVASYTSFERFVLDWITPANVRNWLHFRPQTSFLSRGVENLCLDFIGHFENLEEDFAHVCNSLAVSRLLCHLNPSVRRHYRTYYSPSTAEIVGDVYAEDIEAFGYTYGGRSQH